MGTLERGLAALALMAFAAGAPAAELTPEQTQFRGIYEELVEINTTLSANNCNGAVEAMAARLPGWSVERDESGDESMWTSKVENRLVN